MIQLAEQDTEEPPKYIWHFLQGFGLNYTIDDNPEKHKRKKNKRRSKVITAATAVLH